MADGMRPKDFMVFSQYCREKQLWILVRQTNEHSLKYIGATRPGPKGLLRYTPKPIFVKPKTADRNVGTYQLAGLVVDPRRHSQAFDPDRLQEAQSLWDEFSLHYLRQTNMFRVDNDKASPHCGCLMVKKNVSEFYIHGDYDLKDIVEVGNEDWNLTFPENPDKHHGARHNTVLLLDHDFAEIQRELNLRLGVDMIQHSSEAQFKEHKIEPIIVFSPQGTHQTLNNDGEVRAFYQRTFKGRNAGNMFSVGTFIRG